MTDAEIEQLLADDCDIWTVDPEMMRDLIGGLWERAKQAEADADRLAADIVLSGPAHCWLMGTHHVMAAHERAVTQRGEQP